MTPPLRQSAVRLALAAAGLIALLLALRPWTGPVDDGPSIELPAEVAEFPGIPWPAAAPAPAPVRPWTIDDLGAPDDPLPAPLPLPIIADAVLGDEAADLLARQVLAGTSESFAALITALQASGIGIVGQDTTVAAAPAAPWQGLSMQRWEARTAAAMVLPERSVTIALTDLAAFLTAAVPALQGAPVESLIAADLRGLAESQVPTRRFFGRFIAALGRRAVSHPPYDLLGDAQPQAIVLDGLQASLVLRRLALDVQMRAAEGRSAGNGTSVIDALGAWLVPPVHAQGQPPCAMSDRTQSIMDVAAFGSSLAWGGFEVGELGMPGVMQRLGLDRLGNATAVASMLLAYAQVIATYAALEAEVTMDASPLVRRKDRSPGERRQLTAIVKLNIGNAQMLNCFRALLIAAGLDFNLSNNGPVKGARVRWYGVEGFDQAAQALHGGPEAIVQFVAPEGSRIQGGGDVSSGLNPVTNAVTGEDGKVEIGVEGRPRNRNLSRDPTEVHTSAKVRLQVALKGADLFGDLQEAAGTAAGGLVGLATLPIGVLTRAQWASTGHYRFPVTDWRDGPGEWSGTISVVETRISSSSGSGPQGAHQQQETETKRLEITLVETVSEFGADGGGVLATVKGRGTGTIDRLKTNVGWQSQSCGPVSNRRMNNTSQDHSHGTGEGEADVTVTLNNGLYSVAVHPRVEIEVTGQFSGTHDSFGEGCVVTQASSGREHVPSTGSFSDGIGLSGTVDPRSPDALSGSKTEELPSDGASGDSSVRHVVTTTWNLRRH